MHPKLPLSAHVHSNVKHTLTVVVENEHYEGQVDDSAVTMMREQGETPQGNQFGGHWVLRVDGVYVDHDQYRTDLAERYNIYLKG